jgi:S-adenosylmethionine uptake transporter
MAMRVGDIGFVAPFRYTSLIWAIALGWLVFQSLPDVPTLVGAGIVIATGIFTLYRERKLALARVASG